MELGYTSKLIDFDSSHVAGSPPPAEEIVGTINYYSPELVGYIQEAGVSAGELGVASDLFALGLIFTEFLTGAPPPFDAATYHEPLVAIRSGETLRIPRAGIAPALADLVDAMLSAEPARRPTITQVHSTLMAIRPPRARRQNIPDHNSAAHRPARKGCAYRAACPPNRTYPAKSACRQAPAEVQQPDSVVSVWRCRVCEGVNRGGRTCATCGAEVPPGEVLRAAVRTRLPSQAEHPPPPVPPTPGAGSCANFPLRTNFAPWNQQTSSGL